MCIFSETKGERVEMYRVQRTDEEVNALLYEALERVHTGNSKFSGLSYEEGIVAAIDWLNGDTEDNPMAD